MRLMLSLRSITALSVLGFVIVHSSSSALRASNTNESTNIGDDTNRKNENVSEPSGDGQGGGPPVIDLSAPPMGFMSWERFRCQTNCEDFPDACINENLYMEMADALETGGYVGIGYNRVHIDDCWSAGRDPKTQELVADPNRFPNGIKALADYVNSKGVSLGIYSDAGPKTCAGYEGSRGYEDVDAATFAKWNVDYVKLDGCHLDAADRENAYTAFGNALKKVAPTKPMVYSCSWPAYITTNNGGKESEVPFDTMYNQAGCNTWRNWEDMDNKWDKVKTIIMHWADNWKVLYTIPQGSFNDADMLIAGDDRLGHVLSVEIARLQFGFWSLISSPLLIGGDVRKIQPEYQAVLMNSFVLSVSQDVDQNQAICTVGCNTSLGTKTSSDLIQVWMKHLAGASIPNTAFGFFNLGDSTVDNITYQFPLKSSPELLLCSDLWSNDPSINMCAALLATGIEDTADKGPNSHDVGDWNFRVVKDDSDGTFRLEITALNVSPTSHRMLRIYLRYSSSSWRGKQHNEDDHIVVTKKEFRYEAAELALHQVIHSSG